jgi:hypothetical protein
MRGHSRGRRRSTTGSAKSARTMMFAIQADLKQPWEKTARVVRGIRNIPARANAFVMNLAVHYLAGSTKNIANLADLCRELVAPGGHVIFTTMLGSRIHALLEGVSVGESWDSRQDGVLKYSVRRDYASETLTASGQQVGVLLPFSNGEYYPEYLVNVATFRKIFGDRGFELVEAKSLDGYLRDFEIRSPRLYKQLTPDDKKYVGLYGEIVFRRPKLPEKSK